MGSDYLVREIASCVTKRSIQSSDPAAAGSPLLGRAAGLDVGRSWAFTLLGQYLRDGAAQDPYAHVRAFINLEGDFVVLDVCHDAEDAGTGEHLVVLLQRVEERLTLLALAPPRGQDDQEDE